LNTQIKIGIIGLGYVGLPLARLFATKYPVVGFDININRVEQINKGVDTTNEVENGALKEVLKNSYTETVGLFTTSKKEFLKDCNYYIVTVPTSVDKNNQPVLTPLISASETIAGFLKKNDIVVYESTVYPGATEEDCIPVLEKESNLVFNKDFFVGYSPERISPGDKIKTVENILKVTSGSNEETAIKVDTLYKSVLKNGTHLAPSIKVAEASKIIENCQRDINIAFVNELSKIFSLMDINTNEVLEAASTKWNFLPFKPGLVGGHCIGVDLFI
jgi:UDP-N-acetyl-D-glucosamine/UDP-N-acetyl-D-galactosamine dehydrogenase